MISADAPAIIRAGRAFEEATIGRRHPDDDFVSVMMANHARKVLQAIRVPDLAMTMAFHNAIGEPTGVTAEEVWTAMIDAAISQPAVGEEGDA